jgi:hypothetical protein
MSRIARNARADFKHQSVASLVVAEAMAICVARPEACRVPGAQNFFALVDNNHDFTHHDVDELVRMSMPVALTRPSPGRQP